MPFDLSNWKWLQLPAAFLGLLVAFSMETPSAKGAQTYLEGKGYTRVAVGEASGSCGKSKRNFPFRAISPAGRNTSGEICHGGLSIFTSVSEQ